MNLSVLRRPLLAIPVILTIAAGIAFVVVGVLTVAANTGTFGVGVAAMLICYGAGLVLIGFLVASGRRWALGLMVASALLHACAIASYLTSEDRQQTIVMAIIAPFVLATVVTSMLAVGRGELLHAAVQQEDQASLPAPGAGSTVNQSGAS